MDEEKKPLQTLEDLEQDLEKFLPTIGDPEEEKHREDIFNISMRKKDMLRALASDRIQSIAMNQVEKRLTERPDEMTTMELLKTVEVAQAVRAKSQQNLEQTPGVQQITINQQNNISVNKTELSRESKERVQAAIQQILENVTKQQSEPVLIEDNTDESTDEG